MKIKKEISKLINKILYPHRYSSEAYRKYLEKRGGKIGKYTFFYNPKKITIDETRLKFIEIGERCHITGGVKILAHDYSYAVLRSIYHCMPERDAMTKIGNNVFIGMDTIVLMGSTIGDNVIIGAGSVVHGNIPSNTIWAGNPAKQIGTIEDYYKRLNENFEKNAYQFIKRKQEVDKRLPKIEETAFYKVLFLEKNEENRKKYFEVMPFRGDNKEEAINDLMKIEKKYNSIEEFMEIMRKKEKEEKHEK